MYDTQWVYGNNFDIHYRDLVKVWGKGGVTRAEVGKVVSEVQRVGKGVVSSAEGGLKRAGLGR